MPPRRRRRLLLPREPRRRPRRRPATKPLRSIRTCNASHSFAGTEPGDLHVDEGEHIYLLEAVSDDWWRAQSLDGARTGIVPTTYVQQL